MSRALSLTVSVADAIYQLNVLLGKNAWQGNKLKHKVQFAKKHNHVARTQVVYGATRQMLSRRITAVLPYPVT